MNWHMFSNEDNLVGNDRLYNKFLDIYVLHPRTHIKDGRALYTDYEVHVKTNHPEFAIKESQVRRRYSEFVWLKNRLGINDVMMSTAPSLPGKRYFGRFKDPFLLQRQFGLQSFMNNVVEVNPFLSDPALHLFLQTDLLVEQMERYLEHCSLLSNIRDRIIMLQKNREQKAKEKETQTTQEYEHSYTKTLNLKKTLSSDCIYSMKKKNMSSCEKHGGKGWSQYLGDDFRPSIVKTDRDVTDFSSGASNFHTRMTATAHVLPGGQLCLPDDNVDMPLPSPTLIHRRSVSWHGNERDVIDLLLDSYDILPKLPAEAYVDDSMSFSQTSKLESSVSGTNQDDSSDDGTEIDISKRLSEYTIVPLPPTNNFSRETTRGFHHSFSGSYDER